VKIFLHPHLLENSRSIFFSKENYLSSELENYKISYKEEFAKSERKVSLEK